MPAGESAAEQAAKKRERARQLERDAERWERGAEGERYVGSVLDSLPDTHVVFHDLKMPAPSKAIIDHLVISPGGIWAINTKHYSNPVTVGRGRGADTLWTARTPLRRTLEKCVWEATAVADLIGYPVNPLMCVIAPQVPHTAFSFADVRVCVPGRLASELIASDRDPIDVAAACAVARRVFGAEPASRTGRTSAASTAVPATPNRMRKIAG